MLVQLVAAAVVLSEGAALPAAEPEGQHEAEVPEGWVGAGLRLGLATRLQQRHQPPIQTAIQTEVHQQQTQGPMAVEGSLEI